MSVCANCAHSLIDNLHGFDQNDWYVEHNKLIYFGCCTYCKECNPDLKQAVAQVQKPTVK